MKIFFDGIYVALTNVYYVQELISNLLSLRQLQKMELTITISNDMYKVFHRERGVIMRSVMINNRLFLRTG